MKKLEQLFYTFVMWVVVFGMSAIAAQSLRAGSEISFNVSGADSTNSVTLSWTAPGDDGHSGTASIFDLRYLTEPITGANWPDATQVVNEPIPEVAGTEHSMIVTGLNPGTDYWWAIKAADEVPNWSALSNVVKKGTTVYSIWTVSADYDGDNIDDIAFLNKRDNGSLNIDFAANGFGSIDVQYPWYGTTPGIWACPADYDGDNIDDYAQLDRDESNGMLKINYGSNGFITGFEEMRDWYGLSYKIIPCPADYNGDGIDDYAQLDKTTQGGLWQINFGPNFATGFSINLPWYGTSSSILPCPADYNGDGKADIAELDRSNTGHLKINYAPNFITGFDVDYPWYGEGDIIPCPANYNGDQYDDYAQLDRTTGYYSINYGPNIANGFEEMLPWYGISPHIYPCPRDYDGDGKDDIATWDQVTGILAINYASNGFKTGFDVFLNYYETPAAKVLASTDQIEDDEPVLPETVALNQNYPNPFNPITTISFALSEPTIVSLRIYNIKGQVVANLIEDENREAGEHYIEWDAGDKATGVYIYHLSAGPIRESKKMILLK